MPMTPYSAPVRSKSIDLRTVVATLDPAFKSPPDVYIFPGGRKFKEVQPAATEDLGGPFYESSDGTSLYCPSASGQSTFYAYKGA